MKRMGVIKSILLIVYLFPFASNAQFRIVGLLNVGDTKPNGNKVSVYHSNAQGRGFSVDEGLKKFLIRPKNIIRVHVIDDMNQSDSIPETDNILMIRTPKPAVQQPTDSIRDEIVATTKKPPKSSKSKRFEQFVKIILPECLPFSVQINCRIKPNDRHISREL